MTPLAQLLAVLSGGGPDQAATLAPDGADASEGLFAGLLQTAAASGPVGTPAQGRGPGTTATLNGIGIDIDLMAMMVARQAMDRGTASTAGFDPAKAVLPEEQILALLDQGDASMPETALRADIETADLATLLQGQSPETAAALSALLGESGQRDGLDASPAAIAAAINMILGSAAAAPQGQIDEDAALLAQIASGAMPAPQHLTQAAELSPASTGAGLQTQAPRPGTAANTDADASIPSQASTIAGVRAETSPVPQQASLTALPPGAEMSAPRAPTQPAASLPTHAMPQTAQSPTGQLAASPAGQSAETGTGDMDADIPMPTAKAQPNEAIAKPRGAAAQAALLAAATRAFDPATGRSGPDIVSPSAGEAATGDLGPHIRAQSTGPTLVQPQAAQPAPQPPVQMLAVQIAAKALNGQKRFDIRLDPPELGRVEIRLDVARAGKVTTHLVVERTETLDLLQRDARALERTLQQAGLDTAKDGLTFSLKDHGDARRDGARMQPEPDGGEVPPDEQPVTDETPAIWRNYVAPGRLDIRI